MGVGVNHPSNRIPPNIQVAEPVNDTLERDDVRFVHYHPVTELCEREKADDTDHDYHIGGWLELALAR